jgi:hypothetical protein
MREVGDEKEREEERSDENTGRGSEGQEEDWIVEGRRE